MSGPKDNKLKLTGSNFFTFNDDVYEKFKNLIESLAEGKLPESSSKTLFKHQRFLYEFMKAHNDTTENVIGSKGLLLFHKLGSGKSISSIAISEACRKYNLEKSDMQDYPVEKEYTRKVIIMSPANLRQDPWYKELSDFCYSDCKLMKEIKKTKDKKKLEKILEENDYHFISYNAYANNAWVKQKGEIPTRNSSGGKYNNFYSDDKNPFNDSVVIIDEVHNILNTITNEVDGKKSYFYKLYEELVDAKNCKIIALSGTPIMNHPFELSFLFNLLRGKNSNYSNIYFETNKEDFDNLFFEKNELGVLKFKNRELFLRRINGLVSYFQGYDDNMFAKTIEDEVMVGFSLNQGKKYLLSRQIEMALRIKKNENLQKYSQDFSSDKATLHSNMSIKSSNVVFPDYCWNKEELRGKNLKRNGKALNVPNVLEKYVLKDNSGKTSKYTGIINTKTQKLDEVKAIVLNILSNDSKPLNIKNELSNISIKMYHIMKRIEESNGPVIVYSQFEGIYGISLMAEILNQNGYENLNHIKSTEVDKKDVLAANSKSKSKSGFFSWTGNTRNESLKDVFNDVANKNGKLIKVFLMTGAGKEGISLRNIRQVHILEPWWNNVITKQVIGRGVRITSHNDLKDEDFIDLRIDTESRTDGVKLVNVFKYYAFYDIRQELFLDETFETNTEYLKLKTLYNIQEEMKRSSIDYVVRNVAFEKTIKQNFILSLLKENAIDCRLNLNSKDYDCFSQHKIINYFNFWNLEDADLKRFSRLNELSLITHNSVDYWKDRYNKVFERKDSEMKSISHNNMNDYYREIGNYDIISKKITFNETYVRGMKKSNIEDNFFETVLDEKVFNKNIIDLSGGTNINYFSALKPQKYFSIVPEEIFEDVKKHKSKIINIVKENEESLTIKLIHYFKTMEGEKYLYIDVLYANEELINKFLSALTEDIEKDNIKIVIKNAVINDELVSSLKDLKLNTGVFDFKKLIIDIVPKPVMFGNDIYLYTDEIELDDLFLFLTENLKYLYDMRKTISSYKLSNRVIEMCNYLNNNYVHTVEHLRDVAESNLLEDMISDITEEESNTIMNAVGISFINFDDNIIYEQTIPEIVSFLHSTKEKMGSDHIFYDDIDDSLLELFVSNNINTLDEYIREYKSSYNRRLVNFNLDEDFIIVLTLYIDCNLLKVTDIKKTTEYARIDEDRGKSYKNKSDLCALIADEINY